MPGMAVAIESALRKHNAADSTAGLATRVSDLSNFGALRRVAVFMTIEVVYLRQHWRYHGRKLLDAILCQAGDYKCWCPQLGVVLIATLHLQCGIAY